MYKRLSQQFTSMGLYLPKWPVRGLILAMLLIAPSGVAHAACYSSRQQLPAETIAQFTADPGQLLFRHPNGGARMVSMVRDLVASDPATLPLVLYLSAHSDDVDQIKSIGAGLGQAALICSRTDPTFTKDIQQMIAAVNNQNLTLAFVDVFGDQTGALPQVPPKPGALLQEGNGGTPGSTGNVVIGLPPGNVVIALPPSNSVTSPTSVTAGTTGVAPGAVGTNLTGAVGTNLTGAAATNLTGAAATNLTGAAATNLTGAVGTNLTGAVGTNLTGAVGTNLTGAAATNLTGATPNANNEGCGRLFGSQGTLSVQTTVNMTLPSFFTLGRKAEPVSGSTTDTLLRSVSPSK